MSTNYTVVVETFAERHYIKKFKKKYERAWDITLADVLYRGFQNVEVLFLKSMARVISGSETIRICKTEFSVAGTRQSHQASGNRCIIAIHKDTLTVHVLLVYHKTDLSGHNETAEWKKMIKDTYPGYAEFLK